MTSTQITPATLVAQATFRGEKLLELAQAFYRRGIADPLSPNVMTHVGCIDRLHDDLGALFELGLLAESHGHAAEADQVYRLLDEFQTTARGLAHALRRASLGLTPLRSTVGVPE